MDSKIQDFFDELADELQKEANVKIKKAMQLFIKVDDTYKRIVLHGTGFKGEINAVRLREHFDTLDLLDMIDDVIWNMEDELENS